MQRDFAAHAEDLAAEKELGEAGLRICDELFWAWEIFQHTGERAELKRRIRQLRRELTAILARHATKAARYRYTRRFARNILKIWPAGVRRDRGRDADQQPANAASSDCSRHTRPADYSIARCTPTSSMCSAPTPAAIQSRFWSDRQPD